MGELVDRGQALRIALARVLDDVLAASPAGDRLQSPSGRKPFPASTPAAHATGSIGFDHHVAELTGKAVGAPLQAPAHHEPAADPCTERDEDHVVEALGGAHQPL